MWVVAIKYYRENMITEKISKQAGQSLLELIIAIGMVTTGLFGVWALFLSNYAGEREAQMHIIGANLAREGIEVVKNIRDSNWLFIDDNSPCDYNGSVSNPCRWDSGLEATNNIIGNLLGEAVYLEGGDDGQLYIDADGFYTHDDTGAKTPYQRVITLRAICCLDNTPQDLVCDNFSDEFIIEAEGQSCSINSLKIGVDAHSRVSWQVKGRSQSVVIQEQLYNWK